MVYTNSDKAVALTIVTITSAAVGISMGLFFGFKCPKFLCFPGFETKPVTKKILIPSLIGMIIMGMIARNTFGGVLEAFPADWTQEIKSICLSILLIRGGLQVKFQGQGLIAILLTIIPQTFEAFVIAFIAYGLFGMPLSFCFAMAYIIACVSPSVMVPSLITLYQQGYGHKRGVISSLITAGTFDDILCIIIFGICKTVVYNQYGILTGSPGKAIGNLFIDNLIGLAAGIVLGFFAYLFNFLKKYPDLNMYLKTVFCIGCAIFFVLVGEEIKYTNSKYIASLTLGYVCYRMWGEEKPTNELGWVWFFITPIFFGSVGASLVLSKIKSYFLGYGAVCIFIGLFVRIMAVLLISLTNEYTNKERIFMAVSWLPKATVQAALAGVMLADGTAKNNSEIKDYGLLIQSVSIFSILICAPIGAVLINTLGPIFLSRLGDTFEGQNPIEKKEEEGKLVQISEGPQPTLKQEEKQASSETSPQKLMKNQEIENPSNKEEQKMAEN